LIATCYSKHSRNRFFGEQLSKGRTLEEIRIDMKGMVAEGVYAIESFYHFSKNNKIDLPLTTQAYEVIYNKKNMEIAIGDLLKLSSRSFMALIICFAVVHLPISFVSCLSLNSSLIQFLKSFF